MPRSCIFYMSVTFVITSHLDIQLQDAERTAIAAVRTRASNATVCRRARRSWPPAARTPCATASITKLSASARPALVAIRESPASYWDADPTRTAPPIKLASTTAVKIPAYRTRAPAIWTAMFTITSWNARVRPATSATLNQDVPRVRNEIPFNFAQVNI